MECLQSHPTNLDARAHIYGECGGVRDDLLGQHIEDTFLNLSLEFSRSRQVAGDDGEDFIEYAGSLDADVMGGIGCVND